MDNLSDLDDCISTLEQLQLTLDFEPSTVKRSTTSETSPLSPRMFHVKPMNRLYSEPPKTIEKEQDFYGHQFSDLNKTSVVQRTEYHEMPDEDHEYPKSIIEMLDFQSVSVRRPKLMSTKTADSDLFSVPECDTTDFPPPPPLLNVDSDNYLKAYSSAETFQYPSSNFTNSSPLSISITPVHSPSRKTSNNSVTISPRFIVDPQSALANNSCNNNNNNNNQSDSSSQSNISNYTDKEPKSNNSYFGIDTMSLKDDPSKQTVVRVFTTDKTTKAIFVNDKMTIEKVIKVLMEKHFWVPSLKSAVVEKVPNLKIERFFEEHEYLRDCITSWPSTCSNMIFFEPREDIYGLFDNAKMYLNDNYQSGAINVDAIKDLFVSITSEQHEYQDYLYIKKPRENTWKRKFCLVNHNGIFMIKKKKTKSSSPAIVLPFNDRFLLYTVTGGWTKQWNAPTPFGFVFKPYHVIDPKSDHIIMFCAADETSLKRWCSNIRLCKYKNLILQNYQHMQNRSIHCSNLCASDKQIGRLNSLSPCSSNKNSSFNFNSRNSLPTTSLRYNKSSTSKFN